MSVGDHGLPADGGSGRGARWLARTAFLLAAAGVGLLAWVGGFRGVVPAVSSSR
jgi:hypothetical protein